MQQKTTNDDKIIKQQEKLRKKRRLTKVRREKKNAIDILNNSYVSSVLLIVITVLLGSIAGMNSAINEGLPTIWAIIIFGIIFVLCLVGIVVFLAFHFKKKLESEQQEKREKCKNCERDYIRYIFSKYGLVDLNKEILEQERMLADRPDASKIRVFNYTTLTNTFNNFNRDDPNSTGNIILHNRHRGIKYLEFYVDKDFMSPSNLNEFIYGSEYLIDCTEDCKEVDTLLNNADYDYLLYYTPQKTFGYVAVSFTSDTTLCDPCPHKEGCDYHNDSLFYRILTEDQINHIFQYLSKKVPKELYNEIFQQHQQF